MGVATEYRATRFGRRNGNGSGVGPVSASVRPRSPSVSASVGLGRPIGPSGLRQSGSITTEVAQRLEILALLFAESLRARKRGRDRRALTEPLDEHLAQATRE